MNSPPSSPTLVLQLICAVSITSLTTLFFFLFLTPSVPGSSTSPRGSMLHEPSTGGGRRVAPRDPPAVFEPCCHQQKAKRRHSLSLQHTCGAKTFYASLSSFSFSSSCVCVYIGHVDDIYYPECCEISLLLASSLPSHVPLVPSPQTKLNYRALVITAVFPQAVPKGDKNGRQRVSFRNCH